MSRSGPPSSSGSPSITNVIPAAGPAIRDDSSPRPDPSSKPTLPREHGGREGPEPTRYGDWEKNGRCIDF